MVSPVNPMNRPFAPPPFYGDPSMQQQPSGMGLAQVAPGPVIDTTQAPGSPNQLLEALKARQAADAMKGNTIQASDPWTALAATLQGGLRGWAEKDATQKEQGAQQQSNSALVEALSSKDPMTALSQLHDPRAQDAYIQSRIGQIQHPAEHWAASPTTAGVLVNDQTGEERARPEDPAAVRKAEEAFQLRLHAMTAAQGKAKTPEQRKALAVQYGLNPDSDEGRAFILTGDLPRQGRQTLTATDKEAILAADDKVLSTTQGIEMLNSALALSPHSLQGGGSNAVAQVTSLFGDESGTNTIDFDNLLQGQVLPQLKVIFGGAPTEGERAILLQLQGSSSLSRDSRDRIINRAIKLANDRLEQYKARGDELRGGTFYNPGGHTPLNASADTNAPPASTLQENVVTHFGNGQSWTLRGGKPARVK